MQTYPQSLEVLANNIVGFLGRRRTVLFAGAGVPMRAGLPKWSGFAKVMIEFADKHEPAMATVMRARAAVDDYAGVGDLFRLVKAPEGDKYEGLAAALSDYDASTLHSLVALPFGAIVTTNYDRSLHDAWAAVHNKAPMPAEREDGSLPTAQRSDAPFIARIHGRVERIDQAVLSGTDFRDLAEDRQYTDFLFQLFSKRSCLFVGFSFLDPAIRHVLTYITEQIAPQYRQNHLALLPTGAETLVQELNAANIEIASYSPDDDHAILWDAIAEASEIATRESLAPDYRQFPDALESARNLLTSSYVSRQMRGRGGPIRGEIIRGLIISTLRSSPELDRAALAEAIGQELPLSGSDTASLIEAPLASLIRDGVCSVAETGGISCRIETNVLGDDMDLLRQGVLDRLTVREGVADTAPFELGLTEILDEIVLNRGWDVGAHFAGANVTAALRASMIRDVVERATPSLSRDRRKPLVAAVYDLLRSPDAGEEVILAELGRLAFGVDVVLQHGRSDLLHADVLPQNVYLDSNFAMPAIVDGFPHQLAFAEAINRWRSASGVAGIGTRVLITTGFVNEIIHHRDLAITMVEELNLEVPLNMSRHLSFEGASTTNVFVGAYGSAMLAAVDTAALEPGDSKKPYRFQEWLNTNAPYAGFPAAREFLEIRGIEVVPMIAQTNETLSAKYIEMRAALRGAYDDDGRGEKKSVLLNHEADQLAQLDDELGDGIRTIFVSGDRRLRNAAQGPLLSMAGAAILANEGFVELVDFLIGLGDEAIGSISKMIWGIRYLDDETFGDLGLRNFFIDEALRFHQAGAAMSMQKHLDAAVREASIAAANEKLALGYGRSSRRRARLLQTHADQFYRHMRETMEEMESHGLEPSDS